MPPTSAVSASDDAFALEDSPNFLELRRDVALRKPDLSEPDDIGELLAALFKENDGSLEAQPTLEKADLMDNVLARLLLASGSLVLGRQHEKREVRGVEHVLQAVHSSGAGGRHRVVIIR